MSTGRQDIEGVPSGDYASYADDRLLALLGMNDEEAFTALYKRYWEKVFYVALKKLGDESVAEDIVQDVFADLWKRRVGLEVREKLAAYLAVAVKYRVINVQARQHRLNRIRDKIYAGTEEGTRATEEWLSFEELRSQLEQNIARLPEKSRLAFQYNRDEGLSYKEIAARMNISEKAVERNIARAVQSLKKAIQNIFALFF